MYRENKLNSSLFITEPIKPMQVHLEVWKNRVESGLKEPLNKYSFYTARTIMVKHPEIYLRADRRFYNHISSVPGYKNAYLENNRESVEFLPHTQYFRSAPFSFDLVDMENIKTTTSFRSLYPARYPFLPYADIRMLPLASTLKTSNKLISELEMASMRYLMKVEEAKTEENVFILYSEEGMAWVADGNKIICVATGEEVSNIPGKVILIFNEDHVWYPLMGRDDTAKNIYLAKLVKIVKGNSGVPELTDGEKSLKDNIKELTSLKSIKEKAMAEIAAVRSTGRYTKWFKFHNLWDIVMPTDTERDWQYYGYLEQLMIRANSLSPISAYIAACSRNLEGYNKILVVDREWVNLASLPNHNYVWGHLWDECLVEYIIDESFRINSGHCMAQACIISSILDMAGIDNYLLEGEVPGSHHFVFVPEFEFTFDNGKLQSSQNTIHWNGPRGNKVLARFHYKGKFASPIAGGHYSGTFSPEEAVEVLNELKGLYNDSIIIYKNGANEINKKRISMEDIQTTDNYEILKKERWENLQLP
jgi:hypothetical protein